MLFFIQLSNHKQTILRIHNIEQYFSLSRHEEEDDGITDDTNKETSFRVRLYEP
jgi:hypothetical protein